MHSPSNFASRSDLFFAHAPEGNVARGSESRKPEPLAKIDCRDRFFDREDDSLAPEGPSIIAQDEAKRNPGSAFVNNP